jgi:hypothetical protein
MQSTETINKDTLNPLDALICDFDQQEQQARESEKQKQIEVRQSVKAKVIELLGDLWPVFEPYQSKQDEWENSIRLYFEPEPIGIAPFIITASMRYQSVEATIKVNENFGGHSLYDRHKLAAFLKSRREALPQIIAARIDGWHNQLVGSGHVTTKEAAQKALDTLLELAPERESRWMEAYGRWCHWRLEEDDRERQQAEEIAAKQEAAGEYERACVAYYELVKGIHARNKERVAAVQAEFDESFTIWQLTYALIAEEDGDRMVDTATVYVSEPEPSHTGYWPVFRNGRLDLYKFFTPVSISGPILTRPSEGKVSRLFQGTSGHRSISVHPCVTDEQIEAKLNLEAVPDFPVAPAVLDRYEAESIAQQAERLSRQVAPQTDSDIPF